MRELPSMNYDINPCKVMHDLLLQYPHNLPTDPKIFIEKYNLDDDDRYPDTVPYERVAAFCDFLNHCAEELSKGDSKESKELAKLAYDILFDDAFGHDCEEVVIATLIISNSVYTSRIDPYEMIDDYLTEYFLIEDDTFEILMPYARQSKLTQLGL